MSTPDRSEQSPTRLRWLQLSFPNETPEDQIRATTRRIADHLFEGASFRDEDVSVFGTITMVSVSTTGIKDLKPRNQLTPEELEDRILLLTHFHDVE